MGPLAGIKVIEIAAMGPVPFAGMALADMGAEVIRVDRTEAADLGIQKPVEFELRARGKRSVALDLKSEQGRAVFLELVAQADIVLEGWRPGVAERLGIGYDACAKVNPAVVYGKATGWGTDGPLAKTAGHDINYIALSGALSMIGPKDGAPVPPLNLVGDYGGGAMYLAFGVLCAHLEAKRSGQGQIVDAAMLDGVNALLAVFYGFHAAGQLSPERGGNILDGGAPYYTTYQTRCGGYLAVGCIEPKFYATFLKVLGLDPADLPAQNDRARWPELRARLALAIAARDRDDWARDFEPTDACVTPILALHEAPCHPHNLAREATFTLGGITHPSPAPRFSRSRHEVTLPPAREGQNSRAVLVDWGIAPDQIEAGLASGAIRQHEGT